MMSRQTTLLNWDQNLAQSQLENALFYDFDLILYGIDYAGFYWTLQVRPGEPWRVVEG